ncbi:Inosine/uridine-preferring nucleoside hydrolase domain-containing protein [Phlyctochytrium arcticum]|nr:Inosine/uridine-preferring nucleoside hydrolase domain-containing protein [Phlyctochytrium arcticum]
MAAPEGAQATASTEPIEIIIDTDVGIDDATAILVGLQHPLADVKAFTIVDGNVAMRQAVKNCKTLLAVLGRKDIPIYAGADGPLVRGIVEKELWPGHGTDGLGGITEGAHEDLQLPGDDDIQEQKEHAAVAMLRMVNERPNVYTIVALGPLTNLGIAISLDPTFLSKVKNVYIMGGCLFAKGNSNRAAEFNIHCDPEAAHIVFHSASQYSSPDAAPKLTLATWELTVEHGFPWSVFDYLTQTAPVNKYGKFLRTMTSCAEALSRSQHELLAGGPGPSSPAPLLVGKEEYGMTTDATTGAKSRVRTHHEEYLYGAHSFLMPDLYALVALLNPESVTSFKDWDVQVELNGKHTRGMTHMDWWGASKVPGPNARVILAMDREVVKTLLEKSFKTHF